MRQGIDEAERDIDMATLSYHRSALEEMEPGLGWLVYRRGRVPPGERRLLKLSPEGRATWMAFAAAFTTLALQVLVHRMVSAKLLSNYAFLVISLTMLGFAFSGVLLSRWLPRFLANLNESVALSSALCALSLVAVGAAFYRADVGAQSAFNRPDFVLSLLLWIPIALLFAIPFTFCGLILGALLSAPELSTRRVYFFDLVGSALGAVAVIPGISWLGVERGALAAGGLLVLASWLLYAPRRRSIRLLSGLAGVVLAVSSLFPGRVFELVYPLGSMLSNPHNSPSGWFVEHVAWDPLARIEVSRIPPPDPRSSNFPCLTGGNPEFLARFKKALTQNNWAFTYAVDYDGTQESLKGIEETIYSAAYHATSVPNPKVLIIGVGGGFDVLTALAFDASDISALEVNGATIEILSRTYADYFHHWVTDPRVHLIHGEGRNFLGSSDAKYDVLQLSGVDSYSGTPGAAHVFSESYLYTAEAFDLYLSRLTDGGILNVMRLERAQPREMLKALISATQALRRAGVVKPEEHLITLTSDRGNFTAVLMKKTPFTQSERERLLSWTSGLTFFGISADAPINNGEVNLYQHFLALKDPGLEAEFIRTYPYDIAPATDVRPFFFHSSYWWHLFPRLPRIWGESLAEMEYSILILAFVIGLATLATIYVPLQRLRPVGIRTQAWRYGMFFAATGLGYLAIEMALIQRFGLLLGHPSYALSVVLASILFSTGVGSFLSGTIGPLLQQRRYVTLLLAVVILAEYLFVFPRLGGWVQLPFAVRAALAVMLVAPLGVLLGTYMPNAVEQLKGGGSADYVPWAWGINGIFSVLAPVLSIAFSMTWGIDALFLFAIPIYCVAGFCLPEPVTP